MKKPQEQASQSEESVSVNDAQLIDSIKELNTENNLLTFQLAGEARNLSPYDLNIVLKASIGIIQFLQQCKSGEVPNGAIYTSIIKNTVNEKN
jgi:hypothetical protein